MKKSLLGAAILGVNGNNKQQQPLSMSYDVT
jgi:hypothetical protein